MSWRDHIKVHPAADLFPMMSESELRELGEDMKANGVLSPIALYKGELVDGRNRLDAAELVGMPLDCSDIERLHPIVQEINADPYTYVLAANIHRRHLTEEQRRELIAKLIKARPEESDRSIAKKVKRDKNTVAKVRKKMESTGEVSPVQKRVGADGKKRKKPAKPKAAPPSRPEPAAPTPRVTGSQEVDVEQHRSRMAALDPAEIATTAPEPETIAEPTVNEVDRRVECVTNTILRHAEGLSVADTVQFFAALRDRIIDIAVEHCGRTSEAA